MKNKTDPLDYFTNIIARRQWIDEEFFLNNEMHEIYRLAALTDEPAPAKFWCIETGITGINGLSEHPHERGGKRLSLLGAVSQLPELLSGGSGDRPVRHIWLSNLE
jgi:hypothetical protein